MSRSSKVWLTVAIVVMVAAAVVSGVLGEADWFGAAGQWAGAAATTYAAIIALRLGLAEGRLRREEDEARALAQARLIYVTGPDLVKEINVSKSGVAEFLVNNFSDRPILQARVTLWRGAHEQGRELPETALVVPGHPERFSAPDPIVARGEVRAWLVRWTDADGRGWYVDQPSPCTPMRCAPTEVVTPRPLPKLDAGAAEQGGQQS